MTDMPDSSRGTSIEGSGIYRRRLLLGGGILVVLTVGIAVWIVTSRDSVPSPGPLGAADGGTATGLPQDLGKSIVFSLAVATNRGDKPAVIDSARPVGLSSGLRLRRTLVSGNDRVGSQAATRTWPSRDYSDLHSPTDFRVAPGSTAAGRYGVQFVFVMKAIKLGRHTIKGVQVDYHVGDTRHRAFLDNRFTACVERPSERRDAPCF